MSIFRRGWFWVPVCVIVAVALGVGFLAWLRLDAFNDLQTAIAELDASDPGWQLADIEKSRHFVPEAENGALVVNAAHDLLPKRWSDDYPDGDDTTPPQIQFRLETLKGFRAIADRCAAALGESRKMRNYPTGRFAIFYSLDYMSSPVTAQANAREIANLLMVDTFLADQDDQGGRAIDSMLAIVNVGRCYDDEPRLIAQWMRIADLSVAIAAMERTLAQTSSMPTCWRLRRPS
jgi:hypothetical protein